MVRIQGEKNDVEMRDFTENTERATGTETSETTDGDTHKSELRHTSSDSKGATSSCCHSYLNLPSRPIPGATAASTISRRVDAQCSICLGTYEIGSRVVWSSESECSHAFHEECMLQWLCKGKKKCPMCRNWFVPGISIEEQQTKLAAATDIEAMGA